MSRSGLGRLDEQDSQSEDKLMSILPLVAKKGQQCHWLEKGSIILLVAKKGSSMPMAILHEGPGPESKSKSEYKEVRNPLQI